MRTSCTCNAVSCTRRRSVTK
jgi:hypothetical protein